MEVPVGNVPLAMTASSSKGMLAVDDLAIYFKGQKVSLMVDPSSSTSKPEPIHDLVATMAQVQKELGHVEQVVKTILEDKEAKVSKVNCYKALSKYAFNQVKVRSLEAQVKMLQDKLEKQGNPSADENQLVILQRALSPACDATVSSNHSCLKPAQEQELRRKSDKLLAMKAKHQAEDEAAAIGSDPASSFDRVDTPTEESSSSSGSNKDHDGAEAAAPTSAKSESFAASKDRNSGSKPTANDRPKEGMCDD